MAFIDTIKERAKADKKTIVLPESMDKRTYEAAEKILKEGIANLVIIGFAINNMYRNVDIDDVILNATGVFIGFGIYKILPKSFKKMLTA